CQENNNWPRTF
nr:immunoglobulin light chain junction region [Macaca mulatta]